MMDAFGLYQPGDSWLHRVAAGPKLAALFLLGIAAAVVSALPAGQLASSLVLLGLGVGGWLTARLPGRLLRRMLLPIGVLLAALALVSWWSNGPAAAAGTVCRLLGLLLAAWVITATTRLSDILQVLTRLLSPLPARGIRTQRITVAVALAIRAIPLIGDGLSRARQARIARNAPLGIRGLPGLTVATIVHAVRLSDAMAEALIARGGLDR